MKFKYGKYTTWVGPYQIAQSLCFWSKSIDKDGLSEYPDWVDDFSEWLSETWVNDVCLWIDSKKEQKITVKLDRWDTWGMDTTLSYAIVPLLIQLRDTKQGSPFTDDEDAPEELRSTSDPVDDENKDDESGMGTCNIHARWTWIINEMIWAFTQIRDDEWQSQFHENGFDKEGYMEYQDRITNGTKLFGKYYQSLWD